MQPQQWALSLCFNVMIQSRGIKMRPREIKLVFELEGPQLQTHTCRIYGRRGGSSVGGAKMSRQLRHCPESWLSPHGRGKTQWLPDHLGLYLTSQSIISLLWIIGVTRLTSGNFVHFCVIKCNSIIASFFLCSTSTDTPTNEESDVMMIQWWHSPSTAH